MDFDKKRSKIIKIGLKKQIFAQKFDFTSQNTLFIKIEFLKKIKNCFFFKKAKNQRKLI
tara:strand:+ start:9940 stop:10116 length:177 start_codon:yes stop_codon:yes gene_type:complete